ncbi:MAG TPA: hypothetical protein PLP21_01025 [Pyrinomonadaceae bacterium]|nr:hypothetical protein [Pyrinomonadaceae bacterium]
MIGKSEEKPYELRFEHRPAYLYVSLRGEANNYEIAKRYWGEIIRMHNMREYTRVLIEKQISRSLDTQDVFRIVTEVAFMARTGTKFAFFAQHFDAEKSEFAELVANNRGLNLKYFTSLPSAERWLAD